jgi:hypothetical protein
LADGWIIAQGRDGFQRHVTGALDGPLVVLFEQDRADQADDGIFIGEDADHLGSPLDLAVEALNRVDRVQLGSMLGREGHIGEHIGLGLIQEASELGSLENAPAGVALRSQEYLVYDVSGPVRQLEDELAVIDARLQRLSGAAPGE